MSSLCAYVQMLTDGMNIVDGKLHIDRQQAMEMRRRMAGSLLGENVLVEIVVEVKGPGSVIGEISMDTSTTAVHRMSARAKGNVTVSCWERTSDSAPVEGAGHLVCSSGCLLSSWGTGVLSVLPLVPDPRAVSLERCRW